MKNNAKHFFCFTAILLLASSFVHQPVTDASPLKSREAALAYGGAYVLFAGKFGGEVTRQEIDGQTEVQVDGCAKGSRIFDFTLAITKSGKTSTLTATSNVLTSEMRTKLSSLTKGDEFEFRKTRAYLPNGKDVVDVHGRKFMVV